MSGSKSTEQILILSADSGKIFSESLIAWFVKNNISARMVDSREVVFPIGEIKCVLNETVRNKPLYVVQLLKDPTKENRSVNDNLLSLCTTIHAARQSDCGPITVVVPQFPYSRQDKVLGREPVTCMLVCGLLEMSGAARVLTIDLHNRSIMGFFRQANLVELRAVYPLIEAILKREDFKERIENMVIVAPDAGASKQARAFANAFNERSGKVVSLAIMEKVRNYNGEGGRAFVEQMILIGDVRGKHVLMVDDMIDTGGTILKASGMMMKEYGAKSVSTAVTFGFFSGSAIENFSNGRKEGIFYKIFGTDAVSWSEEFCKNNPWYVQVSVAPLVAEAMCQIHLGKSVSELLKFNPSI